MTDTPIVYRVNKTITVAQFISVLQRSRLAERRPVHDKTCIEGMLTHSNLLVSAWYRQNLIGIARCLTDFHYACYLSDLAVDQAWHGQGVGRTLIAQTRSALKPQCKLILLAAPKADSYYDEQGFTRHPRAWVKDS